MKSMRSFVQDFFRRRHLFSQFTGHLTIPARTHRFVVVPEMTKIVTHDGIFHADDALACYLLKLLPEFRAASIIRTRNPSVIETADVVVDVGGVYDPDKKRFDHHQRTFSWTMAGLRPNQGFKEIKLSSAGLVYHHFGQRIISELLSNIKPSEALIDKLFFKVYESIIQEVDAIDNGISACQSPLYDIHTNVSSRVGNLKPAWNEDNNDQILMEKFGQAMTLIGSEFVDKVNYFGKVWYPARSLVEDALKEMTSIEQTGQILDLSNNEFGGGFPWKEHLFDLEKERGIEGQVKYAIFQDLKGSWRFQSVPTGPNSFDQRKTINPDWHGLRDEELSEKAGIAGCIFVHQTGFIGGNKTKDGAIEMAKKSLKICDIKNGE